jgi:hypothetical protein
MILLSILLCFKFLFVSPSLGGGSGAGGGGGSGGGLWVVWLVGRALAGALACLVEQARGGHLAIRLVPLVELERNRPVERVATPSIDRLTRQLHKQQTCKQQKQTYPSSPSNRFLATSSHFQSSPLLYCRINTLSASCVAAALTHKRTSQAAQQMRIVKAVLMMKKKKLKKMMIARYL